MKKIIKGNKEIIYPIIISVISLFVLFYFKEYIYAAFMGKEINIILITISLGITGFILMAYTIFLGFNVSKKIKETYILDKINFRFRLSLYLSILLLTTSFLFIFFPHIFFPPFLISFLLLLILLLLLLVDYLNLLFKDTRIND